jgi:hypothetical protein
VKKPVKKNVWKGLILAILLELIFSQLTLAEVKDKVKIQGLLVELNLKSRVMVVNETTFSWDENTTFNNAKGIPVPLEQLRTKTWVYVEGEYDKVRKTMSAKKVYLLPKYIERKERHLYPFIQNQ